MPQIVQILLQPIVVVGDDVASSVDVVVVAVGQLLHLMDGVALLAVADAGCIARYIFQNLGHTLMLILLLTSRKYDVMRKMRKPSC